MKSLQILVILLLFSFILFIIFQLERVESKEGMSNQVDQVPSCQAGDYEDIPACYATLQNDNYLNYLSDFTNEDYILKTQIVTPVCPNDPYDGNTSDVTKPEERIITSPDDKNMVNTESRILSSPQQTNDPTKNNANPFSFNLLQYNDKTSSTPAPSNQQLPSTNASISLPSMPSLPSLNTPTTASTPEKPNVPEPAKPSECSAEKEKLSAFPPCPACERCPEPVVDCKKVIHYKDKQYPVPVEETIFTRF